MLLLHFKVSLCLQSSSIYHVHLQNFLLSLSFLIPFLQLFLPCCLCLAILADICDACIAWCMYCMIRHVDKGLMAFACIWYATGFMIMNICCPWVVCFLGLLAELLQQMAVNYHTHLRACLDSISCLFGVCCADEFSLPFYTVHYEPCYVKPKWTWMLWAEIKPLLLFSHCQLFSQSFYAHYIIYWISMHINAK